MTQNYAYDKGDIAYEPFFDSIQEIVGSSAPAFVLAVLNDTTVRCAAGSGNAQQAIAVNGLHRYNTSNADATHPAGAAGTYDIYVTASDNDYGGPADQIDSPTDYTFGLVIRATGSPPTGVDQYRKVGETKWDGSAITELRQTVGSRDDTAMINPRADTAKSVPLVIEAAASQTGNLLEIRDSAGNSTLIVYWDSYLETVGGLGAPYIGVYGDAIDPGWRGFEVYSSNYGGSENNPRMGIDNDDGKLGWGSGTTTFDTNLYRSAANVLKTDDKLHVVGELEVDGALNHDGTTVGFYGVTPVTRPAATTDIKDALTSQGLLQGTSASALNLDGGKLTADEAEIDGPLNHDGTTVGFFGTTPTTKTGSTSDLKDTLVAYGLVTDGGATPLNLDGGALTCGTITAAAQTVNGVDITVEDDAQYPLVAGSRADSGPGVVDPNDVLLGIEARGWDGAGYDPDGNNIRVLAAETFSATNHGTYMEFATTPTGSTAAATRMTIAADGKIGLGLTPTASRLQFTAGTAAADGITFGTDTNLYRSAANVLKTDDKLLVTGEIELDGAINHDGSTVGFFGATPASKTGSTTDIKDSLVTYGLITDAGATPLNLDGGTLTAATVAATTTVTSPTVTTTGKILVGTEVEVDGALNHDGTTVGFYGVAPVTKAISTADIKDSLVALGLITDAGASPLNLDGGKVTAGDAQITGALDHDGATVGLFGVTPVARAGATADIKDALTAYGLLQGTSATALNLDGGALTAGATTVTTLSGTSGTLTGTAGLILSGNGGNDTLNLSSTATGVGITIGGDTNLYRSGANQLTTDDSFVCGGAALTVSGDLNHDGTTLGFFATASTARVTGFSVTGGTPTDKAFNYTSTTLNEVAEVLGSVVNALKGYGLLG